MMRLANASAGFVTSARLKAVLECVDHEAKWRFANARPDPDFKYRSNRSASASVGNSIDTTIDHGRCEVV